MSYNPVRYRRRMMPGQQLHDGLIGFRIKSLTKDDGTIYYPTIDTRTGDFSCTCKDYEYRQRICKHLKRALAILERQKRRAELREALRLQSEEAARKILGPTALLVTAEPQPQPPKVTTVPAGATHSAYTRREYIDRNGIKWIEYISDDRAMLQRWGALYAERGWGFVLHPICAGALYVLTFHEKEPGRDEPATDELTKPRRSQLTDEELDALMNSF